jgi:hypothetical protein
VIPAGAGRAVSRPWEFEGAAESVRDAQAGVGGGGSGPRYWM